MNKLSDPMITFVVFVTIRDEDVVFEGGDYRRHISKIKLSVDYFFPISPNQFTTSVSGAEFSSP